MTVAALINSLNENAPAYKHKSASETARIRGQLLASVNHEGYRHSVLPYLLEELQNSRHPYLIGGAARGLRGCGQPLPETIPFLLKGFKSLSHGDDVIVFEENGIEIETTATAELIATIGWMGVSITNYLPALKELPYSSRVNLTSEYKTKLQQIIESIEATDGAADINCCEGALPDGWLAAKTRWLPFRNSLKPEQIKLENQDANVFRYNTFFHGKPSLIAFFYTRCDNPEKCSLTITMLAQLQKLLGEKGLEEKVNIAAITYDPYFDNPARLKQYCEARGLRFTKNCSSFRAVDGFDVLRHHFDLGVNYNGTVVNKHKIELYLADKNGMVAGCSTRLRWNNQEILRHTEILLKNNGIQKNIIAKVLHNVLSIFLLIGFIFAPKCPLCFAAYISAFGISSSQAVKFSPWLLPLFIIGFAINIYATWKMSRKKSTILPVYLSIAGTAVVTVCYILHLKTGNIIGLLLLLSSSMIVSLPAVTLLQLTIYLHGFKKKILSWLGTQGTINLARQQDNF